MLHIITGGSGSGKTRNIFDKVLKEAPVDLRRNYLVIVPEQFTLETQKDFIYRSASHGIMNIDILSFPRLAHRVFAELGVSEPVILEDSGKTMIVKKVALDAADELTVFAGKVHRQGFIEQMKSVISEFYQYSIGPEELEKMMEAACERTQLEEKLKDISLIYGRFAEFIKDRFIMNEELLDLLVDRIPDSRLLKDSVIVFDGFTGFTVMQYRVISRLLKTAGEMYVTITLREEDREPLFDLSRTTVEKLLKTADREGCEAMVETSERSDGCISPRFTDSPAIGALERNLFRRPVRSCGDSSGISLVSCESPGAEIGFVISGIRRLVMKEGCKYGDIAVIAGDLSVYENIAAREFERAGIPCFIDSKKSIMGTAPVELVRSMLMCVRNGFETGGVLRFLKTGLTGIAPGRIAKLENYCLARGLRGASSWQKEWSGSYRTRYGTDLEELNALRETVCRILIEPLLKIAEEITVQERVLILKGVLENLNVEEQLSDLAERERDDEDPSKRLEALENRQLYASVTAVFDRITLLLGSDVMPLQEFSEILDTGFREAKLAMIPQGGDSVIIGDMERTRLRAVKALFLIGINEGTVPKPASDAGLLSVADRLLFEEKSIELSPVGIRNACLGEFYLYLNLTKPSRRLFISYHRMTPEKRPGHRSVIFSELMKIFPGLVIDDVYGSDRRLLAGSDSGRSAAAGLLRDRDFNKLSSAEMTLCALVAERFGDDFSAMLRAAFEHRKPCSITQESAKKLYGEVLKGSVTMLEKYAACAYSHFLTYGLKLEERSEFKVGALELGNIYHKAVELYGRILAERKIKWHDVTDEIRHEVCGTALETALEEYGEIIGSSRRNEYIRQRTLRVLDRTTQILDYQVKGGSFEPDRFEQDFRTAAEYMEINGKIDRIDVSAKGGRLILRVIDYKSGNVSFDLVRLYNGLQIQLALYLGEACDMYGEDGRSDVGGAGMYYYKIDDPIIEGKDDVSGKIRKALKLNGPTGDEAELIRASDERLVDDGSSPVPGADSDIVSVKYKKDGTFAKGSMVVPAGKLKSLASYSGKIMENSAKKILNGEIALDPVDEGKGKTACLYCPYMTVCGFDTCFGDSYRKLKNADTQEIWNNIENGVIVK